MGSAASVVSDRMRLKGLAKAYKMEFSDLWAQKKRMENAVGGKYLKRDHLAASLTIPATEELVSSLQRILSGKKGGKVTVTDYLIGMFRFSYGNPRQRFDYCFSLFDDDGGGTLDSDELSMIINSLLANTTRRKLSEKQLAVLTKRYFEKMDRDGGGSVDIGEFRSVAISDKRLRTAIMSLAKFFPY